MPATVENSSSSTPSASPNSDSNRTDSPFTYDQTEASDHFLSSPASLVMDRLRESPSAEHTRRESVDSGYGGPISLRGSEVSRLAVKRDASNRQNRSSVGSIHEQTHLLLEKMFILEKKLNSMETQLKNEQVQRLSLEAKVVKLERDNEQLKQTRSQAGLQLQNFAELFYAENAIIVGATGSNYSPSSSHNTSLSELRSRSSSLSSNNSAQSRTSQKSQKSKSRGSRISHVSM